jgi:alpha-glucosidase (family GH31 glycosyl hydrolase)
MPIYVRAGAMIPLDPVRQYTAQPVNEPTELRIFPGADGEFTLYDDDGETPGYLGGPDPKAIWIQFNWDDSAHTLTIEPDTRMKKWPGAPKNFVVRLAGVQTKPVEIQFSGRKITLKL